MRKNLNGVCPEGEEYARGNAGMPMLRFIKTKKEDVAAFAPFFAEQTTHLSDFSLCFQFMWHKHFAPDHAVVEDCLVLKELYAGKCYFHYPLSKTGDAAAQLRAVAAIERYCRDAEIRLHFTNVPRAALPALVARYADFSVTDIRRWRDYLYEAEAFRTYAGGKYAGQRNHVNKFKKKYPDWRFRIYRKEDEGALLAFLHEYDAAQRAKESYLADEEMDEVYELVPEIGAFGLLCGLLTVGEKIVACAIGERCGDMLVVHVEKRQLVFGFRRRVRRVVRVAADAGPVGRGLILGDIGEAGRTLALVAGLVARTVRIAVDVVDHGVAQGVHELAVGHAVGELGDTEEALAAAGAEQVAQAPREALHAVGAPRDVDTERVLQDPLHRQVVLLVGVGVLERGELGGVRAVGGMPRILGELADLGQPLG